MKDLCLAPGCNAAPVRGSTLCKAHRDLPEPPGVKDDGAKDRWDLLPWRAARLVVKVLTHGAQKYAPDNWREVPDARRRYYAAALRHLTAWWDGEILDPDSGLPHLAHAAACLLFLLEHPETLKELTP